MTEAESLRAALDGALMDWWDDEHNGGTHSCRPRPSEDEFLVLAGRWGITVALATPPTEGLDVALATIEAMSGDAADLTDLMDEAAAMRTVLLHLLNDRGRIHDSGCGICDAGRALLTADHQLPSFAANPAVRAATHEEDGT